MLWITQEQMASDQPCKLRLMRLCWLALGIEPHRGIQQRQTPCRWGNFVAKVAGVSASPTFTYGTDGTYAGTATAQVPTTLLGAMGIKTITISANSKASIAAVRPAAAKAMCMIALDATAPKALAMSGSAAINASNCLVQVNSNNNDAVDTSGSTTIKTAENCFVGKLHTYSPSSVSPAADATCNVLVDPFAGLASDDWRL